MGGGLYTQATTRHDGTGGHAIRDGGWLLPYQQQETTTRSTCGSTEQAKMKKKESKAIALASYIRSRRQKKKGSKRLPCTVDACVEPSSPLARRHHGISILPSSWQGISTLYAGFPSNLYRLPQFGSRIAFHHRPHPLQAHRSIQGKC